MSDRLRAEIQQKKPFGSLEEEAFLNIQRTADDLRWAVAREMSPAGLTPTQYNVLRILRGAGQEGLLCRELAERMITREPDVTRLLDRMAARGWISRSGEPGDRRAIRVRISAAATALLASLDGAIMLWHKRRLGHLGERKLNQLITLLEAARAQTASGGPDG